MTEEILKQPLRRKSTIILAIVIVLIIAATVWLSLPQRLAGRLGYPQDAKLFIIHADDFGVCHSVNLATIQALESGAVTSASVMVPCPSFDEAASYCREHPNADVGLHLTFTNEYNGYRWGPVSPATRVPTLVDSDGNFYHTTEEVWQYASAKEIELELRAQIEKALAAGIHPTHVDSHMGVLFGPRFFGAYLRAASEYRLPAMVPREYISSMQSRGPKVQSGFLQKFGILWLNAVKYPMIDRLYVGGLDEVAVPQEEYYRRVIEDLRPGVSEVLVHLALDGEDTDTLIDDSGRRAKDFNIIIDPKTRELIESKGIILIGYRPIWSLVNRE